MKPLLGLLTLAASLWAGEPFAIQVVDDRTGRGVPLVSLETVNNIVYLTDSAGRVAFDEPGLMDREVHFTVRSPGYTFARDGFGFSGTALMTKPGGAATVKIVRENLAERLYRVTGQGIYRDSVLLGKKTPLADPVLNAGVLGQDSALTVVYRGKIYWFWGDTSQARYPLGNFQTTGAVSDLPEQGGLPPDQGVNLRYFTNADGTVKHMVPFKEPGMIWLDGLLVLPDEQGRERLVAHYSRMKSLDERLEHGLVVFNDEKQEFEKLAQFDLANTWQCPRAHPVKTRNGGRDYFYFPTPWPEVRVPATWQAIQNPASYEKVEIPWPLGKAQLYDEIFNPIPLHASAITWNALHQCWVLIGQGTGENFGNLYHARAKELTGPWGCATKVVEHLDYSFYNPVQHPFFGPDGGRYIYFEATYSRMFSKAPVATPRYDYNQIMYRLDLDNPRLGPASKP
jgi:hypothetical protein